MRRRDAKAREMEGAYTIQMKALIPSELSSMTLSLTSRTRSPMKKCVRSQRESQ